MRQKRVLLRLVEPMDFVNEKDRLSVMKFEPFLGEGDFLAQLGGSFVGGMERLKSGLGAAGDDPGERRFAAPWRTPENHGADISLFNVAAERLAWRQQALLPDEPVKIERAHAGGKRNI